MGAVHAVAFGSAYDSWWVHEPNCGPLVSEVLKAITTLARVMGEQFPDRPDYLVGSPVLSPDQKDYANSEGAIVSINDYYAKDVAEVVACFEKAADLCEESGV